MKNEKFNIGFLRTSSDTESMFLSITPGFEHGPGIQRDGITAPRMRDPHSVPWACFARNLQADQSLPPTTDPYIQRAGTWTLYHHVKKFVEVHGSDWVVIGVQSCGDLTMNPWHVAYLGNSHLPFQSRQLCGLLTENDPSEPIGSRIYRCLVKWKGNPRLPGSRPFDWLDITFHAVNNGFALIAKDQDALADIEPWLAAQQNYNQDTRDIAPFVEFVLSGKPIVEKAGELSLANAIDRFQDIRHVFNLPTVRAHGAFQGEPVKTINFGEYQLFHKLNERRAALSSAVIIDLKIGDFVTVDWDDLQKQLIERHFRETNESPTRRGFFRRYVDDVSRDKAEIFFPHNVYPFGVLGSHDRTIVCLASGGLSGKVGNTLEGITRIMYDFLGCTDAMVLDEGYDTFQIVNPACDNGCYRFDNDGILRRVLGLTKRLIDQEHQESLTTAAQYGAKSGLKTWPLNKDLCKEMDSDVTTIGVDEPSAVIAVAPHRSQMRSVLIFAAPRSAASS